MYFDFFEYADGYAVDTPSGEISLMCEPTDEQSEVWIKAPGDDIDDGKCRIHGNTYEHKDKIKKLPYGDNGTEWTGDVWIVDHSKVHKLVGVFVFYGIDVNAHGKAVAYCEGFGELRNEVPVDDGDSGTMRVMYGPHGDGNNVSQSWAEDAAELGNYDDVEVFCEEFGLNPVPDEQIKEELGIPDSDDRVEFIDTDSAT